MALLNRQAQSVAIARPDGPTAAQLASLDDVEMSIVEGVVAPWPEGFGPAPTEAEIAAIDPYLYHLATLYEATARSTWQGQRPANIPAELLPTLRATLCSLQLLLAIILPEVAALKQAVNAGLNADLPVRDADAVLRTALAVIRAQ